MAVSSRKHPPNLDCVQSIRAIIILGPWWMVVQERGPPSQPLFMNRPSIFFLQIWDSNLQQQVEKEFAAGKTVLFAGHSIGGATATLATLFHLELGKGTSISCITFGFPLIGDEVLARAIRRKGWDKRFCHAVSRGDIFSRVLFAPCITVSKPLEALLPYWQKSMEQMNEDDTDIVMEEAPPANLDYPAFLKAVLLRACAVVNLSSAENMDPTNKLIASLKPAVKLSPYRPFGIYVFCSDKGGLWVENYEAVLPILYYSLATATHSISEHTGYGRVFHDNTPMAKLEGLPNLALVRGAALSAMEFQLDALGLGVENTPARLALRAAGEVERQRTDNVKKVKEELDKADLDKEKSAHMTKLRDYRNKCKNLGYYDTFKQHKTEQDFNANINRLNLAGTYDRIEEMVENHQLPDDFQCNEEWIRRGTEYRLLVEPLDIANYYRLGKHEDSGHYIKSARPRRYKALEKWLADSKIAYHQEPDITRDSCFWAHVEELTWFMSNARENPEDVNIKCQQFMGYVRQLMERNELCWDEVVMGESSLVKLSQLQPLLSALF